MDPNYGTPIPPIEELPPQPAKKSNTTLIIIIVVLVVLCCCCAIFGGGGGWWLWNSGDQLIEDLSLLPLVISII
jgi:hypothetical protein